MTEPKPCVVITGGTSGLGYETAKVLASSGWHVLITSRNLENAHKAATELNQLTRTQNAEGAELELASQPSIRAFTQILKKKSLTLKAIICNAGISLTGPIRYTEEGIEKTFGVNHLGHFLLVNLLLEQIQAPARIVFVSSGTHIPDHTLARRLGMPVPVYPGAQELAYPKSKAGGRSAQSLRYTTSKLCNVLCASELARRLTESGLSTSEAPINVYSIDPGLMPGTGLTREYPPILQTILAVLVSGFRPFVAGIRTSQQSARDVARLILDPKLNQVTGTYYDGLEEVPASPLAYDLDMAKDLWDVSAKLTGLTSEHSAVAPPTT